MVGARYYAKGTLVGATLGWGVVMIMAAVSGVIRQRIVLGILVAFTLGVGQYGKSKYNRPYAFVMFNLTFWLVIQLNVKVVEDLNIIETSLRVPMWRFLQVRIEGSTYHVTHCAKKTFKTH